MTPDAAPAALSTAPDPGVVYTGKECDEDGCTKLLPAYGQPGFGAARKKCDEHFVGQKSNPRKPRKPKGEGAGVNVSVDLGKSKSGGRTAADQRVVKVTNGATQMAKTVAVLLATSGNTADAEAILGGADAWGQALGELSRYQPVLEKIFAPTGEVTGQGLAWIAVIAATAGIVVPVFANHGMISPEFAQRFAGGLLVGSGAIPMGPADDAATPPT